MRFLILSILIGCSTGLLACSIFTCARNGRVLAGANEDGTFPFTYARIQPAEEGKFGAIFFGYSDLQAQAGVNEHGLFFDFAAIPPVSPKESVETTPNQDCSGISELLHSCRTVDEVLAALSVHPYTLTTSQLLVADARGGAAVINAKDIVRKPVGQDYLITTNFAVCDVASGAYDCLRYEIIDRELDRAGDISVEQFQGILSDVHQEGAVSTLYSMVCDLTAGKIHLSIDHDFTRSQILDVAAELAAGYRIITLEDMFAEQSYSGADRRMRHPQYFREELVNAFTRRGATAGFRAFDSLLVLHPGRSEEVREGLTEVPFYLLARTRLEHDGQPLFYYFNPDLHNCEPYWRSDHDYLDTAVAVAEFLEAEGLADGSAYHYEVRGYLHLVRGEPDLAELHYRRANELGRPDDNWGTDRRAGMLAYLADLR